MKRILFSVFIMSFLSACQMYTPEHIMKNEFDVEQARNLMKTGNNKIIGNAFFRQAGGGVVTCAGNTVTLIPATAYAEERMLYLYNSTEKGINRVIPYIRSEVTLEKTYQFIPTPNEYLRLQKETICDSSGHFTFNNITNGSFFIVTETVWDTSQHLQGGVLMQKVTVENGETKEVIITHR